MTATAAEPTDRMVKDNIADLLNFALDAAVQLGIGPGQHIGHLYRAQNILGEQGWADLDTERRGALCDADHDLRYLAERNAARVAR